MSADIDDDMLVQVELADEDEGPDPYVEGYRAGYVAGYTEGTNDGRFQGYTDAKWRAYKAVEDDPEATKAINGLVGEL